jgi:hypothetical protein
MLYVENIFICLVAPIIVLLFFVRGERRTGIIAVILGMVACLLSAYVSAFFSQIYGADVTATAAEITPVIEEAMKLLPVVFFLAVFNPDDDRLFGFALIIAISFATFENICFLMENGAASISMLMLRGFGTGAMHLACVALAAQGLIILRQATDRIIVRVVSGLSMLCISITFHAIFNVLVAAGGALMYVALAIPIVTSAIFLVHYRLRVRRRRLAAG